MNNYGSFNWVNEKFSYEYGGYDYFYITFNVDSSSVADIDLFKRLAVENECKISRWGLIFSAHPELYENLKQLDLVFF